MGDDSPDISSSDSGTTTDFGDTPAFDPGSSAPADGGAPQQNFYTPPGADANAGAMNTDANLSAAFSAVDSVAGMQFAPTNASAGNAAAGAPGTDNSSATAASSNNPQAQITQAAAQAPGSAPANAPQPESLVSKLGGGLLSLAKSPGGGTILGNVLQGMAAGKAQEAAIAEHRRYTAPFSGSDFQTMLNGASMPLPSGYLERARRVGQFLNGGAHPSVGAPTTPPPARFGG